jgi:hypothetical protein
VSLVLTEHARLQATRRGLDEATVLTVAQGPEQVVPIRPGREVRQSRVSIPPASDVYLVRVVVDTGPQAEMIVTVYRTSKIDKYWRTS